MFKNMTIGKRIGLGFGLVLMLLFVTGLFAFLGTTKIGDGTHESISKNELIANLSKKEIDHLNWANKVSELLTNDKVTKLEVQTDDHKCAFGKWLYSDARKEAETDIPELSTIFKEIEGCHNDLHVSAIAIGKHFKQADIELPGLFTARMVDHLKWADVIRDAFLANKDEVKVQTDPTKCALGKWLGSAYAQKVYANADTDFKKVWDETTVIHGDLHKSAIEICSHIAKGEEGKKHARKVFDEKTLPILHDVMGHLTHLKTSAEHEVAGMKKANEIFATQTKASLEEVQALLNKASGIVTEVVEDTNSKVLNLAKNTNLAVGVISITAIIGGVILAVLIGRKISRVLKQIILSLTEGSEQVASSSAQVSSASQSLAEGATEQAAGLEETSSSLEEMSSMTKQNADNAQQANTLASEARKAADTGTESMTRMSGAINDIQKSSDETAKIIKVIDEIAFQTNLLALNAAVEAARAGEAGKGFAVVAEEVRNLAMRSAEAAKNTSAMIEESVKNSKNGVDIAAEVGKVLEEIVGGIGKTSELVSEIAAASQEQSQGIDQINTAMNQMDKVTQQNAANAEESASASEELSAQAEQMNEVVNELAALVGGSSASITTGQPRRRSRKTQLNHSDQTFHQIVGGSTPNCWEIKKCGRTPGGEKVAEFGLCPAYPDHGKSCWKVAGTFCGGKVQGSSAQKLNSCVKCQFYKDTKQAQQSTVKSASARAIPFDDDDFSGFNS